MLDSVFAAQLSSRFLASPPRWAIAIASIVRPWAGAPINSFSLFPLGSVTVTKGEDKIGTFSKTENSARKFCQTCGGHLFSDHPGMGLVDVYANVVPGLKHEPTLHVYYATKSVSMTDGLPKFKDLPAEFGGSGDLLPD
jgi:hypothetical protein